MVGYSQISMITQRKTHRMQPHKYFNRKVRNRPIQAIQPYSMVTHNCLEDYYLPKSLDGRPIEYLCAFKDNWQEAILLKAGGCYYWLSKFSFTFLRIEEPKALEGLLKNMERGAFLLRGMVVRVGCLDWSTGMVKLD